MIISIIAAMGKNRVIGKNNALPWHLPADLKHFKKITQGKWVIMGRKTFESLKKPLLDRTNIVVTRELEYQPSGAKVTHSLNEALKQCRNQDEIFIAGGASLYEQMLEKADRIYLTEIQADFDGDAFFPEYNKSDWREIKRQDFQPDKDNPYPYSFLVLERK